MKQLKWIFIIALVPIVIIIFGINSCDRNKLINQEVIILDLNLRNELLIKDIKQRDLMIKAKEVKITIIESNLKLSSDSTSKYKSKYNHLQADYNDLAGKLNNVNPDSSYLFLSNIAYPFDGELKYLFNGPQVKGFHLTYLQKDQLDKINSNLVEQIGSCEYQNQSKDSIIGELKGNNELYKQTRIDLDSVLLNTQSIIEVKDKQIGKQTRRKVFWKILTVILSGVVIGTNI